jgi:HSP20 family protein
MYNRTYGCGPRGAWRQHHSFVPPVNIEETESGYTLFVYAPSLNKENIVVVTENDVLSIRYAPPESKESARFTRHEYSGSFERSFDLKGKVDINSIEASYKEGVLKIILPKTAAARQPATDVPVA